MHSPPIVSIHVGPGYQTTAQKANSAAAVSAEKKRKMIATCCGRCCRAALAGATTPSRPTSTAPCEMGLDSTRRRCRHCYVYCIVAEESERTEKGAQCGRHFSRRIPLNTSLSRTLKSATTLERKVMLTQT